jgi:hypothetical protein
VRALALLFVALAAASPAARQRAAGLRTLAPAHRQPAREVARVNGAPLMSDRLEAAVNALIPQESFHRNVPAATLADMRRRALNTLVDEELAYQDGRRRRLVAADAEISAALARALKRYPSRQAFLDALGRAGATLADARREIRRSLIIEKTGARAVRGKCTVTRADALGYFTANRDRFVVPEQLHIYAITIGVDPGGSRQEWADARSRAESALRDVQAGAAFDATARTYSTDPSRASGGDMGIVHRGSLMPEFETAARNLARGEASGVVQTIYGFHIIRVQDILPPRQKTFGETAVEIRKALGAARCVEAREAWLARLRAAAIIRLDGAAQ